jgi:hypothetical protein
VYFNEPHVFISIDLEARFDNGEITEIGVALVVIDKAALSTLSTSSTFSQSFMPTNELIEYIVIKEHRGYVPKYGKGKFDKKGAFAYGKTTLMEKSRINSYFTGILGYASQFKLPVTPVFHATDSDLRILNRNNITALNQNGPVLSTRKSVFSYVRHNFSIISELTYFISPVQK